MEFVDSRVLRIKEKAARKALTLSHKTGSVVICETTIGTVGVRYVKGAFTEVYTLLRSDGQVLAQGRLLEVLRELVKLYVVEWDNEVAGPQIKTMCSKV
jgi:hypothetical protein